MINYWLFIKAMEAEVYPIIIIKIKAKPNPKTKNNFNAKFLYVLFGTVC